MGLAQRQPSRQSPFTALGTSRIYAAFPIIPFTGAECDSPPSTADPPAKPSKRGLRRRRARQPEAGALALSRAIAPRDSAFHVALAAWNYCLALTKARSRRSLLTGPVRRRNCARRGVTPAMTRTWDSVILAGRTAASTGRRVQYAGVEHVTIGPSDGALTLTQAWMMRPETATSSICATPRPRMMRLCDLRAHLRS